MTNYEYFNDNSLFILLVLNSPNKRYKAQQGNKAFQ